MRLLPVAACLWSVLGCATSNGTLHAGLLPILHLDAKTIQAFQDYVGKFEKEVVTPFDETGKLWAEGQSCCTHVGSMEAGKTVVQPRFNADVASGSIHHYFGVAHVAGGTIEDIRRIMVDYPNYPKYFKPDVASASGVKQTDSTPTDEHYLANMALVEMTAWMGVAYDSVYDTHYRRLDQNRWASRSSLASIKELLDPKNPAKGAYPEGEDHGFLWRTNTYWFARQVKDGIDLQVDSISLSRPIPTGFGWWGTKRSKDAVDKMLRDAKSAIDALHR